MFCELLPAFFAGPSWTRLFLEDDEYVFGCCEYLGGLFASESLALLA